MCRAEMGTAEEERARAAGCRGARVHVGMKKRIRSIYGGIIEVVSPHVHYCMHAALQTRRDTVTYSMNV